MIGIHHTKIDYFYHTLCDFYLFHHQEEYVLNQEMIRRFYSVADCQSFTKAAEILQKSIVPSALSDQNPEENIGTQLFNRTTEPSVRRQVNIY